MTSQSPLDRLAGPGNVLSKEPPDANEFAGLVQSGLARLTETLDNRKLSDAAAAKVLGDSLASVRALRGYRDSVHFRSSA